MAETLGGVIPGCLGVGGFSCRAGALVIPALTLIAAAPGDYCRGGGRRYCGVSSIGGFPKSGAVITRNK